MDDDDDERHRDIIIPSIYALLCLCVSTGGVLLVLYVFFPALSQPWQPIAALILIGSPWLFWIFTYTYACAKASFRRGDRQIPARQTTRTVSVSADQKVGGAGGQKDGKQDSGGSV